MKGSKMKKRILAALLCTTMVLNTGVSAMADEGAAALAKSAHVHTESCYEKNKTDQLICTKAEAAEGHVHGDECYEVTSTPELTCTQAETAGHTHDEGCMKTTKNVICGKEEHTHGGDCYETETKDVCSDESEEHTCGDGCVETEEVLKCEKSEHTHDDGCYESETNIVCGQNEVEAHTHGEGCYTTAENKVLKCTLEEVEAHTHNDECYAWEETLVCTVEEGKPAQETEAEDTQKPVETQKNDGVSDEEKSEKEPTEVNLQNDDETGIKVSVKSTSDVIPEDTKVVVASMEMDEEHEAALAEAVSEFEVLGYTAYDISLKDAEDEDITLGENKVEVAIDFEELIPEGINAEEVKDVVLIHITTDEEEKLTAETVGTVEITEEKATVEFEAESFSPYVVTYLGEAEEAVEEVVVEEPVVEDVVLTYTSEDEAYTATVTAAPEVLENVTAFEAVPVTDEEKITALTEQLTAKAAEMQKTSLGFENYEFKFLDAEGNEAVVEGKVKVSLSFAEARLPEAATAENVDAVDAALLETAEEGLEEINGLISAEAGAVKEVVYTTEAPEKLIIAWSGDVYRTLPDYEDDEVVITLAGTEYALQNVVGFNVTPIKEEVEETKEQYAEVAKQLEEKIAEENEVKEEEKEVVGFLAYDITLVDAEGNKLEPQGGVRVSMEYKEAAAPEAVAEAEEAEVTIHHFEEDEKGEVKQIVDMVAEETIEAGVTTTEKAEVEKAEFVTEGFSVFTITWTREIGDESFLLDQRIKLLLANGSEYTELDISQTTIESLNKTISGEGTPPTLFMDSITLDGDNESLFQITDGGRSYKFVKAIVAEKTNDNKYKAKFPELVVAIQAKNEIVKDDQGKITQVTGMEPRYMLEDTGLYRKLADGEEIAFVYTAGNFTTTASYCTEDGKVLKSGQTYNFIGLLETGKTISQNYSMSDLLSQNKIDSSINEGNDTYNFAYVAVEHLGVRVLPKYIRYNGTSGAERLQYCVTEVTEEGTEEWVDVIDAKVSLVYRHTGVIPTENTAGIVDINLFNYNFKALGEDRITQGTVGNIYFGTGNNSGDIKGEIGNYAYNKWTGGFSAGSGKGANLALQGMVKTQLQDGYPVLCVPTGTNQSLASLFDPNQRLTGAYNADVNSKESYVGLNHLFKKDGGYYVYDSDENYAYYTSENGNKNFTIYDAIADKAGANKNNKGAGIIYKEESTKEYPKGSRGDFMPFVPIGEKIADYRSDEKAYHLGMTIGFNFIQPEGKIDGKDMVFRFSGDDDVWVFVDGKLLLDIGGIHSEASGEINFTTGTVTVKSGPKVDKSTWNGGIDTYEPGMAKSFKIDNDGKSTNVVDTEVNFEIFKPNTAHRLEFFYLERGADMSNCAIEFNLQPVDVQSIEVKKEIVNTDKELYGDADFSFKVFLQDQIGSEYYDVLPQGMEYTLYRDGEVVGTRFVGANGIFKLKHNESAVFKNINSALNYYVQEVSMSDKQFELVKTNKEKVAKYYDSEGNEITVNSEVEIPNFAGKGDNYIAQSATVKVADVRKVLFENQAVPYELRIKKEFAGNIDDLPDNTTFTFKVWLEDRDGVMVPYENGEYLVETETGTVIKPGKTTDKDGKIYGIKVGQTVIIKKLVLGTEFYVEEVGLGEQYMTPVKDTTTCGSTDKKFKPDAQGDEVTADGVIQDSDNRVIITNALEYDWEIIKVSSSEGADVKYLGNAEFELLSADGTPLYSGTSYQDDPDDSNDNDLTGKIIWKNSQGSVITEEEIQPGTYILKETKAPAGYLLSTKEWTVEITRAAISVKDGNTEIAVSGRDEDGTVTYTITITNDPLYELPSTGGHGIYTTMLSGFALMLGAAYVWFTSRRKEMLQ